MFRALANYFRKRAFDAGSLEPYELPASIELANRRDTAAKQRMSDASAKSASLLKQALKQAKGGKSGVFKTKVNAKENEVGLFFPVPTATQI